MIKNNEQSLMSLEAWQAMAKPDFDSFYAQALAGLALSPQTKILLLTPHQALSKALKALHIQVDIFHADDVLSSPSYDVVIDVLGAELTADALAQINALPALKIAFFCPSGLNPNTGYYLAEELAFKADISFAYRASFPGLWTSVAKEYVGELRVLCPQSYQGSERLLQVTSLPKRPNYAYKGQYRRVFVLAGDPSMFGAAILAAWGALIAGAGWVEVWHPSSVSPAFGAFPELIWRVCEDVKTCLATSHPDDIFILGPGLQANAWGAKMWEAFANSEHSMVLDAGALHYLAKDKKMNKNWILTPHPGEAACLLGKDVQSIQQNRFQAVRDLYEQYQAAIVLKGAGSLVYADEQPIGICPYGHPGMAVPGMGDALSGLIAGFLAQHLPVYEALSLAVVLHAAGAETWRGQSLRTSQLLTYLQDHMQDLICRLSKT